MDERTFAEESEKHRHELRVHCYRMLGSFTDAEDLVQETLLKAWRKRDTYQGRASFKAWLYGIATNACLDFLGRPAAREVVAVADGSSAMAEVPWLEPFPDVLLDQVPDAAVVAKETIELAFLATLQHLPPRQRAVLILRDVLGHPAEETATALEMSVPSVKSALQRARATMRVHLPERRSEWTGRPRDDERRALRRLVEATERNDLAALKALLRSDARQCMPPGSLLYVGRDAIISQVWEPVVTGPDAWGDWRAFPLAANRQPAVGNLVRPYGEKRFTPVNIDVLRVEDGLITEITTFGPELFPAFGLPTSL